MKFTLSLLALAAVQTANAFVVPTPQGQAQTVLQSSYGYGVEGGRGPMPGPRTGMGVDGEVELVQDIWNTLSPVTVQGGSLRTWSFATPTIERVQVILKTEGRPLNANVELWQGPDNSPQRMGVYVEDGSLRPFSCVIETPRGYNSLAIRNTGQMEFPLAAAVDAEVEDAIGENPISLYDMTRNIQRLGKPRTIQGGAIHTYPFSPSVDSVQIMLKTDGRPLNARLELLQGPNNNKQVIELYTEDGLERPFFAVFETPGSGNVVRVVNTATMEFPFTAVVEPYEVGPGSTELFRIDGASSYLR